MLHIVPHRSKLLRLIYCQVMAATSECKHALLKPTMSEKLLDQINIKRKLEEYEVFQLPYMECDKMVIPISQPIN